MQLIPPLFESAAEAGDSPPQTKPSATTQDTTPIARFFTTLPPL
jgi:hypothetical protein